MKNLKIGQKIGVLLSILLLVNAIVVIKLIFAMSAVNDQSTEIATNWLPTIRILGELNKSLSELGIAQLHHVGATDDAMMKTAESEMAKIEADMNKNFIPYEKNLNSDEERALWATFRAKWSAYLVQHKKFLELSRARRIQEAYTQLFGQMDKDFDEISAILEKDTELNNKGSDAASAHAASLYARESLIAKIALGISVVFAGIIIRLLTRNVAVPIRELKEYMGVLQRGDYDQDVPLGDRKDEIGEMSGSIEEFRKSLITTRELENQQKLEAERKLARQARVDKLVNDFDLSASTAVTTVASAATELSQTAINMSDLAVKTNEQAVGVASASHQTAATVQSVAAAAEELSASVQEISQQVSLSVAIVSDAKNETQNAGNASREMLEAAHAIGTVTALIENIAGQINLLALNATIESARAGEAGKGFAVVASEVKTLATQTSNATGDIRQKLENLQVMAENVANALEKLGGSVNRVSEVSSSIASAVEEQNAVTREIAANMNSTSSAVDQVNNNIGSIRESTETTSAATQEILSASDMLSRQAEELSAQVRGFLDNIKTA
jgi:methyl-accepting chemotaxis protein